MPDFISQLNYASPTVGLHDALVLLYDAVLNNPNTPDGDKEAIARIRAQTDIALKTL